MRLRKILAAEGLIATGPSQDESARRTEAVEDFIKSLRVSGASKKVTQGRIYDIHENVQFDKGDARVELELSWSSRWDKPQVRGKGYAPKVQGGAHKPVWKVEDALKLLDFDSGKVSRVVGGVLDEILAKYAPKDPTELKRASKFLKTPPGWSRTEGWGSVGPFKQQWDKDPETYWVSILSPEENIRIAANLSFGNNGIEAAGHTDFKTGTGWMSFSRRGIDDSFYVGEYGDVKDLAQINGLVAKQVQKALKRIDSYQGAATVALGQGAGTFTLTPKRLAEAKKTLASGKSFTLTPGGFGTGYVISTRRFRGRYGVGQAPRETAQLLGVRALYWEAFDHD